MALIKLWQRVRRIFQSCLGRRATHLEPVTDAKPETPPWPPQDILNDRVAYMSQILARPPRAIKGTDRDTPLRSLYRLYEYLVLDHTIGYRNEIEYFWRRRGWPVADIPDPKDRDPARYAFLAAIPQLLVYAFNSNVQIGYARYTPPIISPEEAEVLRNTPEEEKIYESVPEWTRQVKPLKRPLTIPMVDEENLITPGEEELDRSFREKNIRLGRPHVLFT